MVRSRAKDLREDACRHPLSAMNGHVRPAPEQIASLTLLERTAFELGDALSHPRLSPLASTYNRAVVGAIIASCGGRRFDVRGLEHLAGFGPKDSLLIVANHRSFFDFFTITAILYWRTKVSKRIFFPVRQTFFYDHPLGPVVNLAMSGMRMFPPVMRDREKRVFNAYMLSRCIAELDRPDIGTVIGIHPEGTRGRGPDPYELLPAQPGVGRVALGSTRAHVIPVFVLGMGQSIVRELRSNLLSPASSRIDMLFGPPVELADLRAHPDRAIASKLAADRCLDAIRALGEQQRRDAQHAKAGDASQAGEASPASWVLAGVPRLRKSLGLRDDGPESVPLASMVRPVRHHDSQAQTRSPDPSRDLASTAPRS